MTSPLQESGVGNRVENRLGEHRFARPALADHADDFPALNIETHVIENVRVALVVGH